MSQTPQEDLGGSLALSLSKTFSRLGWTGFWLQVLLGSLPVITLVYSFSFTGTVSISSRGFPFIEYLASINLLTTLFTTYWSFHYTRVARRIIDPERRPSEASITRSVWTGVVASAIGIFFSTVVILIEAANLLFYFLKAPQAGIPVIQTSGVEAVRWVSTADMVSLVALILTLFAEVIVLGFNLWLLYRTTPRSSGPAPVAEVATSTAGGQGELKPAPEPSSHSPMGTGM
jgi:hypothetical protein